MKSCLSVSVVIPVYNCEPYLGEAIQSVIKQTYPVHEIIVVDDGSTDQSIAVTRQFPQVSLLTQRHLGAAAARNLGIQTATSDFIAFLDADDLWLSTKLEQQLQAFMGDPNLDMVFTYVQQFITPDIDQTIAAKLYCPVAPIAGFFPTTTLVRKSAFKKVGVFSEDLQVAEFIDWFKRSETLGLKAHTLVDVLARRRLHSSNSGIRMRQRAHQEYLKVAKAALTRHRDNSAQI